MRGSRRGLSMRFSEGFVPCVEVVKRVADIDSGGTAAGWRVVEYDKVVKRFYGFTFSHATGRAIRWLDADN